VKNLDKEIVDKALKGEKLSLKDKFKARMIASSVLAKNYRLAWKTKKIAKDCYNNLCKKCLKKVGELEKPKYSDDDAYDKVKNGYLCDKCSPNMIIYLEHMRGIKRESIKI